MLEDCPAEEALLEYTLLEEADGTDAVSDAVDDVAGRVKETVPLRLRLVVEFEKITELVDALA